MRKFVQSRTLARLEKFDEELKRAAHDPGDEKAIHDLRVAIRRFNQCLRTFAQFFESARTKPLRRRLRKLMDRCGAARNCDIALEVLEAAGNHDRKIGHELKEQRRHAEKELTRKLPSWRKHWRVRLHVNRKNGAGAWDLNQSVAENARRVLPALAEALFAAGDAAAASDHHRLHRFRLKVKQFRYTFELFQPVYEAAMKRGAAKLQELQDKLGAISDCSATLEIVKKDRRAAAAIRKLLTSREAEFRKYWVSHCGALTSAWWKSTLGEK